MWIPCERAESETESTSMLRIGWSPRAGGGIDYPVWWVEAMVGRFSIAEAFAVKGTFIRRRSER